MKWDSKRALIKIVFKKYNTQFFGNLDGWTTYLHSVGIERERWDLVEEQGVVSVPCPNSTQARLLKKSNIWLATKHLYMTEELAEKIIVLGEMP